MNSADAGEVDDLVELGGDLGALHAHDRALQEHVLAAGQVRMEAGGHFDQRADPAAHLASCRVVGRRMRVSSLRIVDLPGAVRADDAQRLARPHLERDVVHGPELLWSAPRWHGSARSAAPDRAGIEVPEAVVALAATELLRDAVEYDCRVAPSQMFSANLYSARVEQQPARDSSRRRADAGRGERRPGPAAGRVNSTAR